MKTTSVVLSLCLLGGLALTPCTARAAVFRAEVIFSDNFDGSAGADLNGTTPDVTTGGASWVAVNSPTLSRFDADGGFLGTTGTSTLTRGGSATLAFTPENGLVYTLDASITGILGDADWIALGFAMGQSTAASTDARFINGDVVGKAWMLARGDNSVFGNAAHTLENGDPFPWSGGLANANGGDLDMRIVLDTTGATGNWKASWHAKRPADGSYTEVRPATTLTNQDINSVGFAVSGATVSGTIESFSLSVVPEPSSAALLGLGLLGLLRRRRR